MFVFANNNRIIFLRILTITVSASPTQILQHSHWTQTTPFGHVGPPRNPSVIPAQNLSAPTSASLPFPVSLRQPTPTGYLQTSVSSMPQPMFGLSPSPITNQPSTPHGVSSGLSGGPANMGPMAPLAVPPTRPVSLSPHLNVEYKPPQPSVPMLPRPDSIHPPHAGISLRATFWSTTTTISEQNHAQTATLNSLTKPQFRNPKSHKKSQQKKQEFETNQNINQKHKRN